MAYSEEIMARAEARLRGLQTAHENQQEALRREIYAKLPRTEEIDRHLRRTAPKLMAASFRQDGTEAVQALRRENLALQSEEEGLLRQNGYPADALANKPLCPLCNDRGWKGSEMCTCLKALCKEEQTKELSSLLSLGDQSFERFRIDYYPWQSADGSPVSPRQRMEKVLAMARNYGLQFGSFPMKNLYFYGAPGLGKTFLSACIARVVVEQGFSVVYDSAPTVFARFETRKFARDDEAVRQAEADAKRYLTCDLLILDDLGSEFTTPFVQSALYEVVNTRLTEGRRTVISSNLDMNGVRQRYSPQLASRLEGEYALLAFYGEDIRAVKKRRGPAQ